MPSTLSLTKPPPPPPGRRFVAPKPSVVTHHKTVKGVQVPMHDTYVPAWVKVLRDARYPLDVVVIDFETYFDDALSLRKMTTAEYVGHRDFEIVGMALTEMSGSSPFADYEGRTSFWPGGDDRLERRIKSLQHSYGDNLERCTVVMQNARFDALVLARHFGIYPPHVVDTLGLARHWHSRSRHDLATLAKRYKLPDKGDTQAFKELTFRCRLKKPKGRGAKLPVQIPRATPEQVQALAEYARNDAAREWELFTILLPRLSNPNTELRLMQHTLELWTKSSLRLDEQAARRIIADMEAEVAKALDAAGVTAAEISGTKSYESLMRGALVAAGDDPDIYFKPTKSGEKIADAKMDPERDMLLRHADARVRELMNARVAIKSWPLHIARVERFIALAAASDGYMPMPLKYCGAHTGRWSGDEKINPQNLGSRGHPLISAVRSAIIAPPGHKLVIVDASQVEARGLAWIAGQDDLVAAFAAGAEIYCGFATKVLGKPVRKPKKGGIPAIEEWHGWARNSIGKVGILGCGYGMGAGRTADYAGGAIDEEMAQKIVTVYREENKAIVQFWRDIERAFAYTAKYRRTCTMPRGLRFDSIEDCDVVLTLPNGRELKYHNVRVKPDRYGDTIEVFNEATRSWEHVWGGHLTENVVQAFCRDLLAEAFLRLEDLGHHTAHHVHDEIVLVAPEDRAEKVLAAAVREMSRRPTWAPDLPVGAEGVISDAYGKH